MKKHQKPYLAEIVLTDIWDGKRNVQVFYIFDWNNFEFYLRKTQATHALTATTKWSYINFLKL